MNGKTFLFVLSPVSISVLLSYPDYFISFLVIDEQSPDEDDEDGDGEGAGDEDGDDEDGSGEDRDASRDEYGQNNGNEDYSPDTGNANVFYDNVMDDPEDDDPANRVSPQERVYFAFLFDCVQLIIKYF
jgi:hypothetical protein